MHNLQYLIKDIKIEEPSNIIILELCPENGGRIFDFKPGQYVMISYKNELGEMEEKHSFSISSSPLEKRYLRLGIKILGKFTQGLAKMKKGEKIFIAGPFGKFVFDERKNSHTFFFAGGIGITPFISALNYATDNNLPNKLSLIYSNKTFRETTFFQEIKNLEEKNRNIKTLFAVTDEKNPPNINGLINRRINQNIIKNFIGDTKEKNFFICGPLGFMNAVKENLINLGAEESQIATEEFAMIPAGFFAKLKNIAYPVYFSAIMMLLPFFSIYASNKSILKNKAWLDSSFDPIKLLSLDANSVYGLASRQATSEKENLTLGGKLIAEAMPNNNQTKKNNFSELNITSLSEPESAISVPEPVTSASDIVKSTSVLAPNKNNIFSDTAAKKSPAANTSIPQPVTSVSTAPSAAAINTITKSASAISSQSGVTPSIPQPVTSSSAAAILTPSPAQNQNIIPSAAQNNSITAISAPQPITASSIVAVSTPSSAPANTATNSAPTTSQPASVADSIPQPSTAVSAVTIAIPATPPVITNNNLAAATSQPTVASSIPQPVTSSSAVATSSNPAPVSNSVISGANNNLIQSASATGTVINLRAKTNSHQDEDEEEEEIEGYDDD